ncbi:hypothetical protein OAD50_00885 [Vicingaceae bacterium]|nr:hypothetical protein [Vicingaceae bacterium]
MNRVILLIGTFLFCHSFLAQQKTLSIIEGSDTTDYNVVFHELDSQTNSKLVGYFEVKTNQPAIDKYFYLGLQSGKEHTYFPNGQIYELSIYQKGERDGDYSRYNSLGELVVKARYLEGKLSGFYIDRKKNYQGKYKKGLKNGKWEYNIGSPNYYKEFYEDGIMLEKRQVFSIDFKFRNSNKYAIHSEPKTPKEDSILIPFQGDSVWYQLKYISQELLPHPAMRKAYFKKYPNQLAQTKYVYNGFTNGMYKTYYPNGNLYLYANYTAGLLDGSWKVFDENGKLQIKGNYLDGKKVGPWKISIGTRLERKEIYRNGVLKNSSTKPK